MKNKYTHFCFGYIQNKHKTHGKHSKHYSVHVKNDMCDPPPPIMPAVQISCDWHIKHLVATFMY